MASSTEPETLDRPKLEGVPDGFWDFWVKRSAALWMLAALIFVGDQITKAVISGWLARGVSWPAEGFLRLTHIGNSGAAFSIFQGNSNILSIVALVAIALLLWVYRTSGGTSSIIRFALGLQLGGAVGNLFDRLTQGYVTDFIDVGPWPIFNIADSAISVGMVLMLWYFFTMPKEGDVASEAIASNLDSCPRCADIRRYGTVHSDTLAAIEHEDPA